MASQPTPTGRGYPLHQKIAGVPSDQGLWKPLGFPQEQPAKNNPYFWRAGVYRGRGAPVDQPSTSIEQWPKPWLFAVYIWDYTTQLYWEYDKSL